MTTRHHRVEEHPDTLVNVLAREYGALRPDSDYTGCEDTSALARRRDEESRPFAALCLSGGGIRSATFALGVLQAFARRGLLSRFDYLSMVSGGGNIGGWLIAWIHRAGGLRRVIPRLRPGAARADDRLDPIAYLRAHGNYLAPHRGIGSGDPWALVATGLRNMLLNWMVMIPLLMVVLLVPRLYLSLLNLAELGYGDIIFAGGESMLNYRSLELNAISHSTIVSVVLPLVCLVLFTVALYNLVRALPGFGAENISRNGHFRRVLLPLVSAALAFILFDSLYYLGDQCHPSTDYWAGDNCSGPASLFTYLGISLVPCVLAWVAYWRRGAGARDANLPLVPVALAVIAMAFGAAVAVWVVVHLLLPRADWPTYVTLGPPLIVIGFVLGSNLFVGLSSAFVGDDAREWMSRNSADLLIFCVGWAVFSGASLIAPTWIVAYGEWAAAPLVVLALVTAWASAFAHEAPGDGESDDPIRSLLRRARFIFVRLSPYVFIVILAIALSFFTNLMLTNAHAIPGLDKITNPYFTAAVRAVDNPAVPGTYHPWVPWYAHDAVLIRSSPGLLLLLAIVLSILAIVMGRYVNINTFSLHGVYRDRLVRAFLGASNPHRRPNRFTGFAPDDDIALHALEPGNRPMPVVNMALNLVDTDRLDWQQRKAQSFTATPFHCGNYELGYRPSDRYGGPNGLSLGTALAISGAHATPNRGSHTSIAAAFIMTLFNARLGTWLGNPGEAGAATWRHPSPRGAIRSMLDEALGRTANRSEYVYLSDGSHFENLGLYEMVLRGCRFIVLLDAGCDPDYTFEDLGNALRKVRVDLDVPITFEPGALGEMREKRARCAHATIRYSATNPDALDGHLLYIKPLITGTEQPDVEHYARAHPEFPHESTADQFFDESQTESYRMLGLTTIEDLCHEWDGRGLKAFFNHVCGHYLGLTVPAGLEPSDDEPDPEPETELEEDLIMQDLTYPGTPASQAARCRNVDLADMYPRGLKSFVAARLFDSPQWWMGWLRDHWPIPRIRHWAMVTRFTHVREALEMEAVFQVPFGPRMMEMTDGPNFILGEQGGPEHDEGHEQIRAAFRPEDVAEVVAPLSKDLGERIVEDSGGRLDVIEDLVTRVPTEIVETYYGVPIADKTAFADWTIATSGYMFGPPGRRPANADVALQAAACIRPVLDAAIDAAKAVDPKPGTIVGRFAAMQAKGTPNLSDETIRAHLFGMIAGFVPTNTIAAGHVIEMLLRRGDFLDAARAAALADDDARLQRCLFEAMRYKPINPGPFRVCVQDFTLGRGTGYEKLIPAGTKVLVSTQSAMFDQRDVPEPERFNPDRDKGNYMLFGHGIHWCIGAYIAEAQITQMFKPLLKRRGLSRARGRSGRLEKRGPFPVHMMVEFDW